jgi:sugar transferase (PEP-CTERM/EpsH1 system associated)
MIVQGDSMSRPLHVVHVVLSLDCGGLERIVLDLARKSPELGQRVSVICLERPGTLAAEVERAGATVICINKPPGRRPETVGKVREVLRQLRPDVVHTHQIGALLYSGPAAHEIRVPLIVHTEHINQIAKHRTLDKRMKTRLLWWIAGRYAARFFCVSEDIAEEVKLYGSVASHKARVVSNGVDTDRFRFRDGSAAIRESFGITSGEPVIGTVGRLNEVKCQDVLIRSFARVRDRFRDARLLIVGDGPRRAELEALVASLGLEGATTFTGYQARPDQFLHAMDIFALTSRAEGLPLAILEAWAAGLPVVSTRVGGIPKVVEHGRTGLLIDPGDEDALTDALCGLLADPLLTRRLATAGQRRAEADFDTRRMAADYHRNYLELLSSQRERARCVS